MTTYYCNHLDVTGAKDDLDQFISDFHIDRAMIDTKVNEGKWRCDKGWNDDGHREFIKTVSEETGGCGRWDRIRMSSKEDGILISFDSTGGHGGSIVSWMAENHPGLAFSIVFFNDPHQSTCLRFQDGEWAAEESTEIACGKYGTYSDRRLVLSNENQHGSPAEAREALRRWLIAYTGCTIQHDGWPCGTCFNHLLTRIGLDLPHPAYRISNAEPDRANEVWRAIVQIREADLSEGGVPASQTETLEEPFLKSSNHC